MVAGPYSGYLTCLDGSERMGELNFEIVVTNPTQANINLVSPTPNVSHTLMRGDSLELIGTITDDADIQQVQIIIEPAAPEGNFQPAGGPIYNETFAVAGSNDTTWDFAEVNNQGKGIYLAPGTTSGTYELIVLATDNDGNVSKVVVDLSIF